MSDIRDSSSPDLRYGPNCRSVARIFVGVRAGSRRRQLDVGEREADARERATYVQQRYAMRNPKGFEGYGEHVWGITASDGPGPLSRKVNGVRRRFLGYRARAIPWGPDDGTLAPWAVAASLPFAPDIVLPTLDNYVERYPRMVSRYGLVCSFNPTLSDPGAKDGWWISGGHFAIDQGPVAMMIENYRSGLIWRLLRRSPVIVKGLLRAGFTGGWLGPP